MADQWTIIGDRVQAQYVAHPEMIQSLLERLGGTQVTAGNKVIRCTCPLHRGDNSQAFAVWIDKGYPVWRCYTKACGKGNLITLLMKKFGTNFPTAVTWLALVAGLQVDGPHMYISPEQLEGESLEQLCRRVGIGKEQQPNFFDEAWVNQAVTNLWTPTGYQALDLLTGPMGTVNSRGEKRKQVPPQLLKHFQVGFVPAGSWVIPNSTDPTERTGYFEDRIVFPWRDWDGRCIGFSGRRMDGTKYLKYKTFPGTKKAQALYGLHDPLCKQAIRDRNEIVIVEGFHDLLRGWQYGQFNVTSAGGTEFSSRQIDLIARLNPRRVVLFFDGDEAGTVSSRRMSDQINSVASVCLARTPEGVDPDELPQELYIKCIRDAQRVAFKENRR